MCRVTGSRVQLILMVAATLLVAGSGMSRAGTVSLVAARDNTLIETETGSLSNGSGPSFFVGETSSSSTRRAVLFFDIAAGVPDSATIDSVRLVLHLSRTSEDVARVVSVHRLLAGWGEGSSSDANGAGSPSTTNDATWIHRFFPSVFWTTPGGDFDVTVHAQTAVNNVGFYSWAAAGLKADVQAWLDNPATNFGWLLKGDPSAGSARRFDSRENTTPDFRPHLTVYFTPKAVAVESTTWGAIKARG